MFTPDLLIIIKNDYILNRGVCKGDRLKIFKKFLLMMKSTGEIDR